MTTANKLCVLISFCLVGSCKKDGSSVVKDAKQGPVQCVFTSDFADQETFTMTAPASGAANGLQLEVTKTLRINSNSAGEKISGIATPTNPNDMKKDPAHPEGVLRDVLNNEIMVDFAEYDCFTLPQGQTNTFYFCRTKTADTDGSFLALWAAKESSRKFKMDLTAYQTLCKPS